MATIKGYTVRGIFWSALVSGLACNLLTGEGVAMAGKAKVVPDRKVLEQLSQHKHHPYDSFSLSMQAVAASFGNDVDYERIYALSTNAFAPDIRPDEECRQHWRMRGRGQCMDLVAGALGLNVRPLGCFAPREYGGGRDFSWPEKKKEASKLVQKALERGEVVITDSGWMADFMLWGIVTEADADGRMAGITPNGRTDNTFDHVCSFWALSPQEETLSEREADLLMLRRAIARIRADRDPFLAGSLVYGLPAIGAPEVPGAVIWGLPALDRWIEQMGQVPYQQDDAASSVGNATLCMWHTQHGAEVAAKELHKVASRLRGRASESVSSAANRYARIAGLFRPALGESGPATYAEIMGDEGKQKDHVEAVLKPVRELMAAAAEDIEKALSLI